MASANFESVLNLMSFMRHPSCRAARQCLRDSLRRLRRALPPAVSIGSFRTIPALERSGIAGQVFLGRVRYIDEFRLTVPREGPLDKLAVQLGPVVVHALR